MKRKSAVNAVSARKSPRFDEAEPESDQMDSQMDSQMARIGKFTSTDENTVLSDDGTTRFGMMVGESLAIQGIYNLTVEKGAVRILGATIHAQPKPHRVRALAAGGAAMPLIECIQVEDLLLVQETREAGELFGYRAVIKIDRVDDDGLLQLGNIAPPYKFKHEFGLVTEADFAVFQPFKTWIQLAEKIRRSESRVLVVGPKSSGKSTFCRFLTNYLLRDGPVNYLELDPGQPEYQPPGSLSLHRIESYNLSPSYAHFNEPIRAHSINNTSPKDQPSLFLSYSQNLIKHAQSPLVVNTPGWARGLGLDLLREINQQLNPTHVVYLGNDDIDGMDLYNVENALTNFKVSSDTRTIKQLAYFHASKFDKHLTELAPYQVPYSSLAGVALQQDEGILVDDLSGCINASIVSLLEIDNEVEVQTQRDSKQIPWVMNTAQIVAPETSRCLGYAIVQSIDAENEQLRLLTPVDVSKFAKRRIVLVRGRLSLPVWAMWDCKKGSSGSTASLPYLTLAAKQGAGAATPKVRRVQRQKR